jgi:hypothetical protein
LLLASWGYKGAKGGKNRKNHGFFTILPFFSIKIAKWSKMSQPNPIPYGQTPLKKWFLGLFF